MLQLSSKSFYFVLLILVESINCQESNVSVSVWTVTSKPLNQSDDDYCPDCFHVTWSPDIINHPYYSSSNSFNGTPPFHDVSLILDHPALIAHSNNTFIIHRRNQTDITQPVITRFPTDNIKLFNATDSRWPGVARIDLTEYFTKLVKENFEESELFFSVSMNQTTGGNISINFKKVAPIIVASRRLPGDRPTRTRRSVNESDTNSEPNGEQTNSLDQRCALEVDITYGGDCNSAKCCTRQATINIDKIACGGSEMSSFLSTVRTNVFSFKVCSGPCRDNDLMDYGRLKKLINLQSCCHPVTYETVRYLYEDTNGLTIWAETEYMSADRCICS